MKLSNNTQVVFPYEGGMAFLIGVDKSEPQNGNGDARRQNQSRI